MKTRILENKNIFLFSIDLEDVREGAVNGHLYEDRVVANVLTYLDWLKLNKIKCTFFTVGSLAEKYQDLIKEIIYSGHELACHTYDHLPLENHTPASFKKNIEQNINALYNAGAKSVTGFRAPVFSLTEKTSWAYKVLSEVGIKYSSSVLPANNPLYGWKEFGTAPKIMENNIVEIPMSIDSYGPLTVPFAGGVYFRVLPFMFIKNSFRKKINANQAVTSYFHPYDLDTVQEKFMIGGINNNSFYNFLIYYNRKNMMKRLNKILEMDVKVITYEEYSKSILNGI